MNRREFIQYYSKIGIGGAMLGSIAQGGMLLTNNAVEIKIGPRNSNMFPQLSKVPDSYNFVICSDPQLSAASTFGSVGGSAAIHYSESISDMNAMLLRPAFGVINGDFVNVPTDAPSWSNFMSRTLDMKFLPILVYGNHDGNASTGYYSLFRDKQEICNKTREYTFSWDCGKWHFVAIPCDIPTTQEEASILAWLDADLKANRNRPVMMFAHEHLLPQGLTQLEWYTYRRELRNSILEIIARYGNVKYFICGHVHNGVKMSVKSAWEYRGTRFITAPTGTASRPFGEEYPEFISGIDHENGSDYGGGYYLLCEVRGADITVKGRLANTAAERKFEDSDFRPYIDQEPLWFKNILAYTPGAALVNGSFENDLDGWKMQYRYVADDPNTRMFFWETRSDKVKDGSKSLYFRIREVSQPWAQTEMLEAFQYVQCPAHPVLKCSYFLDQTGTGGGGYFRIFAYSGTTFLRMFLVDWNASAAEKRVAENMPKNSIVYATGGDGTYGAPGANNSFYQMGDNHKAMFWTTSETLNTWHDVTLNLRQVYDAAVGAGAWDALGIDRLFVAVGVWTLEDNYSLNSCYFDKISMTAEAGEISNIDGTPLSTGSDVWYTDFGRNW